MELIAPSVWNGWGFFTWSVKSEKLLNPCTAFDTRGLLKCRSLLFYVEPWVVNVGAFPLQKVLYAAMMLWANFHIISVHLSLLMMVYLKRSVFILSVA